MKSGDKISFEYRLNGCSSVIKAITRKADVDGKDIWVQVSNHFFRITEKEVLTVNGLPNPKYVLEYITGDYCVI